MPAPHRQVFYHMERAALAALAALALTAAACGSSPAPQESARPAEALTNDLFTNGSFTTGDFTGWTLGTDLNKGITYPPASIADLKLQAGGVQYSVVHSGATGTLSPAGLSATASLKYPLFGNYTAALNELGKNQNVNTLVQSYTTAAVDVDPSDGKIHVRFALAPVLENPNHTDQEQPYFYVQLSNLTKGTVLYSTFNFSNQPGVPWKTDPGTAQGNGVPVTYTDWRGFDVAPGNAFIQIGDTVQLEVIAAGCSLGGHFGEVYVDGFGAFFPGPSVAATAPSQANAGTNLTYNYAVQNGANFLEGNVTVVQGLPPNTTFVSLSAPPTASCVTPVVGSAGTVTCNFGWMNPSASTNFSMTVFIAPGTTGTINNGNYSVQADGVSPFYGPIVQTSLTSGVSYADLSITKTDGVAAVAWGQPLTYTIVASNAGPSTVTGAVIQDTVPALLTGATWTCSGSNGGVCGAASGSGSINTTANLPMGGSVTYLLSAAVTSGSGTTKLNNIATIATPSGTIVDPNSGNNAAADLDTVGPLVPLTVNKSPPAQGAGTVVSSPAAINCGTACASAQANFVTGTAVTLSAVAAPGDTFDGWVGPCLNGTTSATCSVTVNSATSVTAGFQGQTVSASVTGGNGTLTCPTPVATGTSATCTVTPNAGYSLATLTDNGASVIGSVVAGSYTINPVNAAHSVVATFAEALGVACTAGSQCASGFCVTGVCCSAACGAYTCAATGNCTASCSSDAQCASGNYCSAGSCVPQKAPGQACTAQDQCTTGNCVTGVCCNASCGIYTCAATGSCNTSCSSDAQCVSGNYCNAGACVPQKAPGQACTAQDQCATGNCVAGVCCNSSACGLYTCAPTGSCNASCSIDAQCVSGNYCSAGACVPQKAPGQACTAQDQCATGNCVAGVCCNSSACGTYTCAATGSCNASCSSDAQCVSGNYCSAGACVPQKAPGQACTAPDQCATGNCVTSVCCNSSACGTYTCAATGSCNASCSSDALCSTGNYCSAGACVPQKAPGQACTAQDQCASGNCVTGVCCNSSACGVYTCGATGSCNTSCSSDAQCVSGNYCSAGACVPQRAPGQACAAQDQCATGNCVTSVCCNSSACGPYTCAPTGSCNASCSSDAQCASGSYCSAGACIPQKAPGQACAAQDQCATGNCVTGVCCNSSACGPYTCAPTGSCNASCSSDAQCVSGNYCSAGVCTPQQIQAASCSTGDQCASGNCADGVCCDTACTGQCESCGLPASLGTCTAVTGTPQGGRAACTTDGSACGGVCDGSSRTNCAYPGSSTQCSAPSCTNGTVTLAAFCAGTGSCPTAQTQSCGTYACGASACAGNCAADGDCASGNYCSGGVCVARVASGGSCSAADQCASGFCADGVCCDTSCTGQCQSCNLPGKSGTCSLVTGVPQGGRAACTSDGSACGGACDGVNGSACSYPGNTTSCRAASCTDGTATLAAVCAGTGSCPTAQTQSCGAFACGSTACVGTCAADNDCAPGNYCSAGVCTAKGDLSAPCSAANQCASGFCTDGVCCSAACNGQCQACDVAGSFGTCTPVSGPPHAGRASCASDATACAGTCDGTNTAACAYPGAATDCRSASCANGLATLQGTCAGTGSCPPAQTQSCGAFACGATACVGNCEADTDCAAGNYCAGGVCVAKVPSGQACAGANQCTSGFCAGSVCCNADCNGQCEACDVAGSVGTCTPVTGAPHAGKPACATDGTVCGGSCDGTDAVACSYPPSSTSCRPAACTNGVETVGATCNGAGSCPPPEQVSCGPAGCGATACACSSNADCRSGATCQSGACVADQLPSGSWHVMGSGCSTAGTGALWPALALLGLAALRRRRPRREP